MGATPPGLSRRALLGGGLARIRERFDAGAADAVRAREAAPSRPPASPWIPADWHALAALCAAGIEPLLDAVAPAPGEALLEIAAGDDVLRAPAAARGAEVHVADGAAPRLEFPADRFDAVASAFGIAHAPDLRGAGRELERVLRPGGRLALLTWSSAGSVGTLLRVARRLRGAGSARGRPERWGAYEGLMLALERFPAFETRELALHVRFESREALWASLTTAPGPLAAPGAESVREEVEARLEPLLGDAGGAPGSRELAGPAVDLRVDACLVTAQRAG